MQITKVQLRTWFDNHIRGQGQGLERFSVDDTQLDDERQWRGRPLEAYYLVLFVDCLHVKVRRDTVATEAFYAILAVN